jgi:hypothetical protein
MMLDTAAPAVVGHQAAPEISLKSHLVSALPDAMRNAHRWLVWKAQSQASGKPRKVPFYVNGTKRYGVLDTPADQAMLAAFQDALGVFMAGGYTGLGFALGPDGSGNFWQGIDLDDIPNRPELCQIADDLPGYTETSPSGNGLHAIGYGRPFTSLGSNGTGIEAYAGGRYFTVTGEGSGFRPPACLADFVEKRLRPMHSRSGAAPENDQETPECEQVATQLLLGMTACFLTTSNLTGSRSCDCANRGMVTIADAEIAVATNCRRFIVTYR